MPFPPSAPVDDGVVTRYNCPLWVRVDGAESGSLIFFNVNTGEFRDFDPDPDGLCSFYDAQDPHDDGGLSNDDKAEDLCDRGDLALGAGSLRLALLGLVRPRWVRMLDERTGQPHFFDVVTGERVEDDPDPDGVVCFDDASMPAFSERHSAAKQDEVSIAKEDAAEEAAEDSVGIGDCSQAPYLRQDWNQRLARRQVELDTTPVAYVQGHEEFNIFHGKYDAQRFGCKELTKDRVRSPYRLNVELDPGLTLADRANATQSYFCIYFARGMCNKGPDCQYYHRLPTAEDSSDWDASRDIFGRKRFADHRDDRDGVGSFNDEARTLFIADLRFDRSLGSNARRDVETELTLAFGAFGPIQELSIFVPKAIAFLRYEYRAAAEFAKVAMANQRLALADCIVVRWATEDRNPRMQKRRMDERRQDVEKAVVKRMRDSHLSIKEIMALQLQHLPPDFHGCTAPFPASSPSSISRAVSRLATPQPAAKLCGPAEADPARAETIWEAQDADLAALSRALSRSSKICQQAAQRKVDTLWP